MPYDNAARNLMLDALGAKAVWMSLHDGDPSSGGANELTGGSPAYERKAVTWNSASSGTMDDSTSPIVFDVPAGSDVDNVGFWSAKTGGTFYAYDPVTKETFAGQGTYTVKDADLDLNT